MRREPIEVGGYYHLYNRGVNRQVIFFQPDNWVFFLKRLKDYFHPQYGQVLAYCLMPNHYHLLVQTLTGDFGHRVMQPFANSYTKAINREQARVGPLFQGPYQFRKIDTDEHLVHLSRYIHLNPVQAGLVKVPEEWEFSSYREYVGLRAGTLPRTEVIMSRFPGPAAYQAFVQEHAEDARLRRLLFDE